MGSKAHAFNRVGWRGWLSTSLILSIVLLWVPQPLYAAAHDLALANWRTLLTGLALIGVAGVAGSTVVTSKRHAEDSSSGNVEAKQLLREIPGWAIWAGMACLVAVGLLATWWLVSSYGSGDSKTIEQNRIKLEAIKIAGSVVVGTGGVAALLLAARRQRVSELDLLQRDRVADANRHDADERRATELYTAAAEQLASDKAPVRMAGMYALSRLGETNENLRQTIINLLCAYLRMPDTSIGDSTPYPNSTQYREYDEALQRHDNSSQKILLDLTPVPLAALSSLTPDIPTQQKQERQVRLTAQRLLTQHLRQKTRWPSKASDAKHPNRSYWPGMDINLANASLHEWDFSGCKVRSADFDGAHFHDLTWFDGAEFDEVGFHETQFRGTTWFNDTHFHGNTEFAATQFQSSVSLSGAQFHRTVMFDQAIFHSNIGFDDVHFWGPAWFIEAQFHATAWFTSSHFDSTAVFNEAQFHNAAEFNGTQFHGIAEFDDAQFLDDTSFEQAQFHYIARVDASYFAKQPTFHGAWARIDLDEKERSTWPDGWTVHPVNLTDGRDDKWGRLHPIEPL